METETQHIDSYQTAAERAKKEKKKERRDRERNATILLLVGVGCLVAGAALGYISGYHQALVDFGIIAGSLI